jgi:subtilisin family serine protease
MHKSKMIAGLALNVLVLCGTGLGIVTAQAQDAKSYVIVAKSQGKGSTTFLNAVTAAGGRVTANLEAIGVVLADSSNPGFAAAIGAASAVQAVAADSAVQWISPNELSVAAEGITPSPSGVNSEPFNAYLWNLRQIDADMTAAAGYRGRGARVAVLDVGIITAHPDIAANVNVALCRSFVPGEGVDPVNPGFNHGTHVAGIIAAPINGKGVQGVAPEAEIVAIKVLAESGSGQFGWLIQGLEYAVSIQADVANMSLGATFDRNNAGGGGAGPLLAALNRAINHATASGILCVSAAGNEGVDLNSRYFSIPAQSGNGMAVSATGPIGLTDFDRLASYSNYGQSVVSVAAPGGDFALYPNPNYVLDMVLSPGGWRWNPANPSQKQYQYFFAAGTSMAAPHVSGLAALIIGKYGKLKPAQIQALIQQSTDDILKPGADAASGKGRINAWTALE